MVSKIFEAAKTGDLEFILKFIKKNRSHINHVDAFGHTALAIAAGNGHADCLKALIDAGADISIRTPHSSPLLSAADHGHLECVNILLNAGEDVNIKDYHHNTPLILASISKRVECVKALVEAGADLYYANYRKNTAFSTKDVACKTYLTTIHENRIKPWYPELTEYYPTIFRDRAEALILSLNIRNVIPLELVFEILSYTAGEYSKNC